MSGRRGSWATSAPLVTVVTALARSAGVDACSWRSSTISVSGIRVLAQCTAPRPIIRIEMPSDRPSTMFWVLAMPMPGK